MKSKFQPSIYVRLNVGITCVISNRSELSSGRRVAGDKSTRSFAIAYTDAGRFTLRVFGAVFQQMPPHGRRETEKEEPGPVRWLAVDKGRVEPDVAGRNGESGKGVRGPWHFAGTDRAGWTKSP